MRRTGFSVVELLTAILILAIIAGTFALSPNIAKLSAKREAEKITAKLESIARTANHRHESVKIYFYPHGMSFQWPDFFESEPAFEIDNDFTLDLTHMKNPLEYTFGDNTFTHQGGHIKVIRGDGDKYFIILHPDGRLRTSPNAP